MMVTATRALRPGLLGVLYAEDFDDEGTVRASGDHDPAQEPEAIEPVFTPAEIDAARTEARLAGRVEAEHGLAAARNQLLELLAVGLADARAGAHDAAAAAAEGVARCMLSALAACLPTFCARHGAAELRALAGALLPALTDEPKITMRIHPQMLPMMQAELQAMDPDLAGRVHVSPTDAVAPGDARITWRDGSAVRDAARVRSAFEDGLALLGLSEKEHAHA